MAGMRYQPQGRIRIQPSGLARGLVFAAVPGGEAVAKRPGTLYGGAARRGGTLGLAIATSGTTSGFEFNAAPDLYSITTDITVVVLMATTSVVAYSHFLCVPYNANSWPGPAYGSMGFQVSTDAATLRLWGDYSTGNRIGLIGTSATRILLDGAPHMYAVAKDSSSAVMMRDRTIENASDNVDGGSAARAFDWSTRNPVSLLNRSRNASGEGTNGQMYLALVWNRKLSNDELLSVQANPWQLFADEDDGEYIAAEPVADMALTGAAAAVASAFGTLSTSIRLAGSTASSATASGTLSTGIRLAGAAQAQGSAAGALSTSIRLAGAAPAVAAATGTLTTSIGLAGTAQATAGAAGSLATAIRLTGVAAAVASAVGTLTTGGAGLAGTDPAVASAGGTLTTRIPLAGTGAAQASAAGSLSTRISLAGAAQALATATGTLSIADGLIDISKVSKDRVVTFEGSGSRVVVFEGSGSRVVIFEGSAPRTRIGEMSIKLPVKIGSKWTVDRDPDEISYYGADITQEQLDRGTTADPSKIAAVLYGVELLEGPEIQVEVIDGVQRTFVVVKLGGVEEELPQDWRWVARVPCMNGERFDKTTWFNKVDP
jgi:hypothetical protein